MTTFDEELLRLQQELNERTAVHEFLWSWGGVKFALRLCLVPAALIALFGISLLLSACSQPLFPSDRVCLPSDYPVMKGDTGAWLKEIDEHKKTHSGSVELHFC